MDGRSVRTIRFVASEQPVEVLAQVQSLGFDPGGPGSPDPAVAARGYLDRVLALDAAARVSFDGSEPEVPVTVMTAVQASNLTASNLVRFAETRAAIPVFGSHLT